MHDTMGQFSVHVEWKCLHAMLGGIVFEFLQVAVARGDIAHANETQNTHHEPPPQTEYAPPKRVHVLLGGAQQPED